MRYLSFTIVILLIASHVTGQTSPHGKEFKVDCLQCHTSENWNVKPGAILFNHDNTSFKLVGQHSVVNCKDCHKSLTFKDVRRNCLDCHTDVHNETLGKNCEQCHTPKTWIISDVTTMHQQTRFPLLGAHRTVSCRDCHTSASVYRFETLGVECVNCHREDYMNAKDPDHVTGKYSVNCLECHSENTTSWNAGLINHDFFALTGGHNIGCGLCHTTKPFGKISTECNTCHNKHFTTAQLPKHVEAGIPVKCENCHTINGWKPSTFNHLSTGYELRDAHLSVVQCSDCHKGNLTSAGTGCISCHQVQYNNAPDHKKLNYNVDCARCHTQKNWIQNNFNHSNTNYPLTGAHITAKCSNCHVTTLIGTTTVCSNCHLVAYSSSQVPGHVAAGIPKDCSTCHTTAAWKPSSFNHTTTGYELQGSHKLIVQCSQCHTGNVTSAPQTCIGCHQAQYNNAPGHKQNNYPTVCTNCHSQNNWLATSFDHSLTQFPLTGSHTRVACASCHVNGYVNTPTACNSCHLPDYNSSQLPAHLAAGIPKECANCHTPASWKPSSFNHTATGYELQGAHKLIVQCSQCHTGNVTSAPQTCIGCHQAQYDNAPGHKQNNYPTVCTNCHSQNNWLAASFDHSLTQFPLTGAHANVICSSCHANGYAGTSTVCSSCHMPAYNSSQLPGHVAAGIPKECAGCHTSVSWKPSSFNHTTTGYELKGAHKSIVQCSDCHKGSTTNTPQTCKDCHQPQFDAALNHKAQSYPADCTLCHTQNNWIENIFNHASTNFPLTGAHTSVLCASCHKTTLKGTSTLCYSCHTAKYNATVNPNHLSAKFPTNCEICHSTTAWTPSTYNHDAQFFPINSGKHQGKWTLCSECHNVSTNYAVFTCILCHEHSNKTSVDSHHSGVKNYAYVSSACYNCHPRGR
jgi:hypothetical protein